MNEYNDIVFMIDQEIEGKIKQLEQQHFEYMNHVNMQINTFQQQIQGLHQSKKFIRKLFFLFKYHNLSSHHS